MKYSFIIILPLLIIIACTSAGPANGVETNAQKLHYAPEAEARIEACLSLAEQSADGQLYQMMNNGKVAFEQTHRVAITEVGNGNGYHFIELYNVYINEDDGTTEYYLSEFTLRKEDFGGKHSSEDFRVVVAADSAYIYLNEKSFFQLSQVREITVDDGSFPVYELLGYSHSHGDDPNAIKDFSDRNPPAYYKYWSPLLGTLLVRSTDEMQYELAKTGDKAQDKLVEKLKAGLEEEK